MLFRSIRVGAKGGRPRPIPIEHHWQHQVAIAAQQFVRRRNLAQGRVATDAVAIAPPQQDLKQAITRYRNVLASSGYTRVEAGVTGHGLRAGYACRRLEELGIVPVVRGGEGTHQDKATDTRIHRMVSESLGHSRKSVVGAYAGAPHVRRRVRATEVMRAHGWMVPGHDAASVRENVRRLDAYLLDPAGFERLHASGALAANPTPVTDLQGVHHVV